MYLSEIPVTAGNSAPTPTWLTQILDIGKGALALKQQSDIQKINTARLQQGLAPIEAGDVAVGAKVAMDTKQLNKILLVAGLGLAGIIFVMARRGRR